MLAKRIICCLDVKDGRVVKGVHFENLRDAGDAVELAERYNREGADELVFLDITATTEHRKALTDLIERASEQLSIPFTVGGGIKTITDARRLIKAGADKVSLNSGALENPELLTRIADEFGSQAVVVAVDAKKRPSGGWSVWSRAGTKHTGMNAIDWAQRAQLAGAGEILLTSIDADGAKGGFDCALTRAVSDAVTIPVIASGGAGCVSDFAAVFTIGGADAALGASVFHFDEIKIQQLKKTLASAGIPMRLAS